jgi:choline dehydrogenase
MFKRVVSRISIPYISTYRSFSTYDYIIVGGGSSGSVLADRLSENGEHRVLLLEAGHVDKYIWVHIPVGYLYCIGNERTDWCFSTRDEPGLNNRKLIYPRGLGLGGCSLINGMIYMRGQVADYENWAQAANDASWRWENVLKYFRLHEDYHGEEDEYHSKGGKWTVEKQRLKWDVLEVFKQAAVQSGVPLTNDFNRGNNMGVGYFDVNQRDGWRLSTYNAFVKDHKLHREKLVVKTNALVDTLVFDEKNKSKCVGVNAIVNHSKVKYRATKEVILAAGSIGTVQILERSGIGREDVLKKCDIPVRQHLPGVGENLQDHLQLRTVFKISSKLKTLNTTANSLLGKAQIGLEYMFFRTGPMSMAPSQLGMFCMSSHVHDRPNIQYHVQPLSLPRFGEDLDAFNAFTASVCNLRPTSRGSVHITSKSKYDVI